MQSPSNQIDQMKSAPRRSSPATRLLAACLSLAILPFIYVGTFARYQADDYCSAQLLRTLGFWGAQWESYTGWSNRFATMLVSGLIDPLDVVGMRILPGLLILGLLAGIYLLLRQAGARGGIGVDGVTIFSLAGMAVFFGLYTTPNPFQSYYWRSGSLTYTLPVICLVFLLAALVVRRERPWKWYQTGLIGLAGFFSGGFSETNAALQVSILAIGLGIALWRTKKLGHPVSRSSGWIAALAGTLLALVVILLAPGNAVRMSLMPEPPGFFRWLYLSARFGLNFIYNGLLSYMLPRGVSFLLAFALAARQNWQLGQSKRLGWGLLIIPAAVIMFAAVCAAPSVYAQSAYPEERALTGANFILTAGVIAEGYLLGVLYRAWRSHSQKANLKLEQAAWTLAVVLLSIYVIYGGVQILNSAESYRARAEAWDARAAQIERLRESGERSPDVSGLNSFGQVTELTANPDEWVNRCAASYYQVDSIAAQD